MAAQIDPSAQVYSNLFLSLYDWFVLWFVNNYIWCCRTDTVLLPFFQAHIGEGAHLDIGAGTGFFPSHSVQKLNKCKEFALLDLNPNTLVAASAATRRAGYKGEIETVNASIFEPPSTSLRGRFDSISIFYVFHCLSGSFPDKATRVMTSLIPALAPGGVIYGSTVLGYSTGHNWLGVPLMNLLNRRGDFGNADDTFEGLEQAFNGLFEEVDIRQVGKVALFTLRKPIISN